MAGNPVNPYASPSATSKATAGRRAAFVRSVVGVDSASCAVLLVAVLVSQAIYGRMAQSWEMELPLLTTRALGPVFPSIFGVLLLATVAIRFSAISEQLKALWHLVLIAVLSGVTGLYAMALWLPFASQPTRLA